MSGSERMRVERRRCRQFHQSSELWPWLTTTAWILTDLSAILISKLAEPLVVRSLAVVVGAIVSGRLFMFAHDACHGSLFRRSSTNRHVARLLLTMTLHEAVSWQYWHNVVHHKYTNLASRDFVWRPFSPDEFSILPRWRRALERVYRHESTLGFAAYYLVEIWARKMLLPSAQHRHGNPLWFLGTLALISYAVLLIVPIGTDLGLMESWLLGAALLGGKLVMLSWFIGFVVYFNHTHPDVRWFAELNEWRYETGQIDCTVYLRQDGLCRFVLPDAIMSHTAHHLDPKIPLSKLREAQNALVQEFGDRITQVVWSLEENRRIVGTCKLYDYSNHRWCAFDGSPAGGAR